MVFEMEKGKIMNLYKANRLVLCEFFLGNWGTTVS